jgi:hypothetical protein
MNRFGFVERYAFLPVIGLVQAESQRMADRYSYIPLIGIFVIIAWGLSLFSANSPKRRALAVAYAETGEFARATDTARQALESAMRNGQEDLAVGVKTRLDLYKARLPYRQKR